MGQVEDGIAVDANGMKDVVPKEFQDVPAVYQSLVGILDLYLSPVSDHRGSESNLFNVICRQRHYEPRLTQPAR